jgi:hypothetical protein
MISVQCCKPHRPILFLQDYWRPVVELIHFRVRPRRYNGEAPMHRFIRPSEAFPDACESQRPSVLPCDRIGLLAAFHS